MNFEEFEKSINHEVLMSKLKDYGAAVDAERKNLFDFLSELYSNKENLKGLIAFIKENPAEAEAQLETMREITEEFFKWLLEYAADSAPMRSEKDENP